MTDALKFDGDFPAATRDQWLKLVSKAIKGADFEKTLVSKTYDDIPLQPLYVQARDAAPILLEDASPWRVDQRIDLPDFTAANSQMHEDASGGADGFVLVGSEAASARKFGLAFDKINTVERLFDGFDLGKLRLRIDAGPNSLALAESIVALAKRQGGLTPGMVLDIACDPIGTLATRGYTEEPPEQTLHRCADFFSSATESGLNTRIFLADGRPYHEAGASEAHELAAVIATALFYFRYFVSHGIELETARNALSFLLVADADEFMTIAKFRALRRLWQRVEQACDLPPRPIRLHAETAWRMMSRYDPWTNLLRCTTAVFSAATGGADAIAVLPFTNALGLPDANARRMARNIQLVLLHEANLWRVSDPAAGSGGFEELTTDLCERAWILFQMIEREGGIASSLEQGLLQARIAGPRQARQHDVSVKRRAITGISEFPDIRAEPVSVLAPFPEPPEVCSLGRAASLHPLPSQRDAEAFERLRDRIEALTVRTGQRPRIFIATMGSPFAARVMYACNFFEVAGIDTVLAVEPLAPGSIASAFVESGATLACLVATDDEYQVSGKAALRALSEAKCPHSFVASDQSSSDASWLLAGSSEIIFPGCNALAALKRAVVSINATTADNHQPSTQSGKV